MSLTLQLERQALPVRQILSGFSPPSLEQLEPVLEQRRRFLTQRAQRHALVELLLAEHQAQDAPASSLRNIERLALDTSFTVVTGQQPALLTGPLYTPWKVLSAILLAARLDRERPEAFVPLFWNAGEDHDTAEMDHFHWLDRQGQLVRFELAPPSDTRPLPFGNRPIQDLNAERLLSFCDSVLFQTEFSPSLKAAFRDSLEKSETLGHFCNQLLWRLFPDSGLVIVNSFSRRYPALLRDLLQRELDEPLLATHLVNEAADQLSALGHKPKMHKPPARCSFFLYQDGARMPVRYSNASFSCGQAAYSTDQLLQRLEQQPGDFSAAANLRPILQDALLPTAVNILGPGEFAYHAQLKRLYAHHGVPQPTATGRVQLTLVPPRVTKALLKLNLSLPDLQQPLAELRNRLAVQPSMFPFEAPCNSLKTHIHETFTRLRAQASPLDKSLLPPIIGHEKQLVALVNKLQSRLASKLRQTDEQLERTLLRLQAVIQPLGQPQERVVNLYYFINLFGGELLPTLARSLENAELEGSYAVRIHHGT